MSESPASEMVPGAAGSTTHQVERIPPKAQPDNGGGSEKPPTIFKKLIKFFYPGNRNKKPPEMAKLQQQFKKPESMY